ncbi:MAG TPA: LON peptidase substrate-binding domain-containing protein, partial [Dongiaceae bacterium]|nr:LON peptidase substrate-binding domain-containing protein [Dongiaceae bacterium]
MSQETMTTLPVFPLNALLMPGCRMPLQIFEKRYLDMVSHCMRKDSGFCVALLRPGSERHEVIRPGQAPATEALPFYSLGTEARIVDFDRRDNGLLAITIQGGQRVALRGERQETDGLWWAQAEARPEQLDGDFGDHSDWTELLNQLLDMSGMKAMGIQADAQHGEQ